MGYAARGRSLRGDLRVRSTSVKEGDQPEELSRGLEGDGPREKGRRSHDQRASMPLRGVSRQAAGSHPAGIDAFEAAWEDESSRREGSVTQTSGSGVVEPVVTRVQRNDEDRGQARKGDQARGGRYPP